MNASLTFNTRAWGDSQESIAHAYLLDRGFEPFCRNFRFGRSGEIDLVMRDGDVWVFVEVKARRTHQFGPPEDAITPHKRNQLKLIARGFFHTHDIDSYDARFDVIAVDYVTGRGGEPEIRHWPDAFR